MKKHENSNNWLYVPCFLGGEHKFENPSLSPTHQFIEKFGANELANIKLAVHDIVESKKKLVSPYEFEHTPKGAFFHTMKFINTKTHDVISVRSSVDRGPNVKFFTVAKQHDPDKFFQPNTHVVTYDTKYPLDLNMNEFLHLNNLYWESK